MQNTHLEQALEWAEIAVSKQFIGQANFTTLSNKALVLNKMGRSRARLTSHEPGHSRPIRHSP